MHNNDMPTRAELPTSRQLIRSTIIAIAVAVTLLLMVVLPAEYAIDPTGIGSMLGLTKMGEIKQQLAQETKADETLTENSVPDTQASTEAETKVESAPPQSETWRDEMSATLAPGEAAEIKLVMKKGETAFYAWEVDQGHLNSDLHTDDVEGKAYSYQKGRAETSQSSKFTAVSDGAHGWYWRNRSDVEVTVTVRTRGEYSEIKRLM